MQIITNKDNETEQKNQKPILTKSGSNPRYW